MYRRGDVQKTRVAICNAYLACKDPEKKRALLRDVVIVLLHSADAHRIVEIHEDACGLCGAYESMYPSSLIYFLTFNR
jgi:hypothetical protein